MFVTIGKVSLGSDGHKWHGQRKRQKNFPKNTPPITAFC